MHRRAHLDIATKTLVALLWLFLQCIPQPGARECPQSLRAPQWQPHRIGRFWHRHPGKIAEFDQSRRFGIRGGKFVQRFIDREQFILRRGDNEICIQFLNAHRIPAFGQHLLPPCPFDEDAPHGFRGRAEKMTAIFPALVFVSGNTQPGFVNERRGLERLARLFAGHFGGGQLAQFRIDERKQFLGGAGIAVSGGLQDAGDLAQVT